MTGRPAWSRENLALRLPYLRARQRIVRTLRSFFAAQGFDEVETPALQVSPGLEPHLAAFATELATVGGVKRRLFLHTSPEFAMKKLLAGGAEKIFQIAPTFRNNDRSSTHHPQFAMLEWYRANEEYTVLMADAEQAVRACALALGQDSLVWRGVKVDLLRPWMKLTVAEAFAKHAGIDVLGLVGDAPGFAAAARGGGIETHDGDGWDDIFFRVMAARIEPKLGSPAPTILYEYPLHMAALARPSPKEPRVAERFEIYVAGLELANAFGELTDVAEQRRRFEADRALRMKLYGEAYPIDEDFLAALAEMPPASGIALGVDRLVMLLTGADHIEQVLWLPVVAVET
jgi:lysyl-tRNA synthetase class 2